MSLPKDGRCEKRTFFSLTNFYALELLASKGHFEPEQNEIDVVEKRLKKYNRSRKSPVEINENVTSFEKKTVLLCQEQPLLAHIHTLLLKNLCFDVKHSYELNSISYNELFSYDLIILSGVENIPTIFRKVKKKSQIFPLIIVLENQITKVTKNKIFMAGADIILDKYFITYNLLKALKEKDFFRG